MPIHYYLQCICSHKKLNTYYFKVRNSDPHNVGKILNEILFKTTLADKLHLIRNTYQESSYQSPNKVTFSN